MLATTTAALFSNTSAGVWTALPSNLPSDVVWSSIAASSSGQYQVVAAPDTSIYFSENYGVDWDSTDSPDNVTWVSLAFSAQGSFVYAVESSEDAMLHKSADYGQTWETIPVDYVSESSWTAVATNCDGQVVVTLGNNSGGIHLSYNYGLDFQLNGFYIGYVLYQDVAISCDGSYMVAVAIDNAAKAPGSGGIYVNTGSGFSDAMSQFTTTNHWTGCAITSDGSVMFAVDSKTKGAVFKSTNSAYTAWQQLMAVGSEAASLYFSTVACDPTGAHLLASYVSSSGKVVAYSYYSGDGGNTWINTLERTGSLPVATSMNPSLFMQGQGSSWYGLMAGTEYSTVSKSVEAIQTGVYLYSKCPYGQSIEYTNGQLNGTYQCNTCPAGTYSDAYDISTLMGECVGCPVDTYGSDNILTVAGCLDCPYPTGTVGTGSKRCSVIWLDLSLAIQFSLYGLGLLWFVYIMVSGNKATLAAFVVLLFPLLDVFTDFAYIATSKFYNLAIFIMCIVMFLHPTPLFIYKLFKFNLLLPPSMVHMWWISYSNSANKEAGTVNDEEEAYGDFIPFPTIYGRRFHLIFSFESHSNLLILFWELITWFFAIVAQFLTLAMAPAFYVLWFTVGVFLQASKTLSISSVWNAWFYVWTGDHAYDDIGGGVVDTEELNYGLLAQFLLETIPHIVLQSTNNTLLRAWDTDPIAIISFVFSILMAFNALYHYFYHSAMLAKVRQMKDVPIDRSIRVGIMGYTCTLFEGKLEAYTKVFKTFAGSKMENTLLTDPVSNLNNRLLGAKDSENNLSVANNPIVMHYGPTVVATQVVPVAATAVAVEGDRYSGYQPPHAPAATLPDPVRALVPPVQAAAQVPAPYIPPRAPPPQLLCPLSHRLMADPVIAEDGYTYDRPAILHYISQYHCSPITHAQVSDTVMTNRTVAELVAKFNATGNII
jgi:photosystem II stability/assembly factor-like uncharacterized protein